MISPQPPSNPAPKPFREPPPQPGTGARLTANEMGFSQSVPARNASFKHPFRPLLGAAGLILTRGLVDGVFEPTIGGVPISGIDGGAPPVLALKPNVQNEKGESWAVLRVMPNAEGVLDEKSVVEIIHTNEPRSLIKEEGRLALVQILWKGNTPFRAFSIVKFHVNYHRVISAPGQGPVRHLFI